MARGRRWTEAENKLLQKMVNQGLNVKQIYESGKFPDRTYRSIEAQIKRLGFVSREEKSFATQIKEAEIVELETVVKRFVDAFNKICTLDKCSKAELERFRIIFSAARVYFDLYFKLQSFEEVKARVERVEKLVEQLAAEKKA